MQIVSDAVDDVQSQALARELEFIKQMRNAGELDSEHAKLLRNDVYIQCLSHTRSCLIHAQ